MKIRLVRFGELEYSIITKKLYVASLNWCLYHWLLTWLMHVLQNSWNLCFIKRGKGISEFKMIPYVYMCNIMASILDHSEINISYRYMWNRICPESEIRHWCVSIQLGKEQVKWMICAPSVKFKLDIKRVFGKLKGREGPAY